MDFPCIKKFFSVCKKKSNKTEILRIKVVFSISILCALKFDARYNAMVKASESSRIRDYVFFSLREDAEAARCLARGFLPGIVTADF